MATPLPLEKQLCSLELSKRLRELGVTQESLFYWGRSRSHDNTFNNISLFFHTHTYKTYPIIWTFDQQYHFCRNDFEEFYSAFTVAELGEFLPFKLRLDDDDWWFWQTKLRHGGTEIRYKNSMGDKVWQPIVQADTEAEARAKMLIYLLANKLMELPK